MKKIAICRFTPYDVNFDSYNVQELGMAKAFCRRGFDVDIIAFKSRDHSQRVLYQSGLNKVNCIEVPRIHILRWGYNATILNESYWRPYDIIVCFEYMQIMCYKVAKLTRKVILYSGPYYNLFFLKIDSPLYDLATVRTYNKTLLANFTKSVLAQKYLEKKGYNKVTTLGVGLDLDKFSSTITMSDQTKEIVEFMSNNDCLLYVGALSERKNYPFMLEVFKEVLKIKPNVKFVLIGRSCTSKIKRMLGQKDENYAKRYFERMTSDVKEGIFHIERVDNSQLQFIYPLAKAFLLPSKLEIFGMVLLEALYLGAPVITSRNGGSMTLIDKRNTGVIINEFDSKKWCDAVLRYLNDQAFREEVCKNGRKLIEQEFTWDYIVANMLKSLTH